MVGTEQGKSTALTEMVKRIRFIKRAQALGFTLKNVAGLLKLNDTDACAKTRVLTARKLTLIVQKISELVKMRDALSKLVGQSRPTSATKTRGGPITKPRAGFQTGARGGDCSTSRM